MKRGWDVGVIHLVDDLDGKKAEKDQDVGIANAGHSDCYGVWVGRHMERELDPGTRMADACPYQDGVAL